MTKKKEKKDKYNPNFDREGLVRQQLKLSEFDERIHNAKYDAIDESGNLYEIKVGTTGYRITTVTTTKPDHIKKWKRVNWILGVGPPNRNEISELYYLPPIRMMSWIEKIEKQLILRQQLLDKMDNLLKGSFFKEEQKIYEQIKKRAMSLHDPKIMITYVRQNGTPISSPEDVRREVLKYPPQRLDTIYNEEEAQKEWEWEWE